MSGRPDAPLVYRKRRWSLGFGVDHDVLLSVMEEFPQLEDIYDTATVDAIDKLRVRHRTSQLPAAEPSRRRDNLAVAGALTASMLRGIDQVLDADEDDDGIVEVLDQDGVGRHQAVSVHLVWGEPAASIAIVRPWLLP